MKFKQHLVLIVAHNRAAMRDCALSYRHAKKDGDVCRMVKQLILASVFRDLNKGYLEAA